MTLTAITACGTAAESRTLDNTDTATSDPNSTQSLGAASSVAVSPDERVCKQLSSRFFAAVNDEVAATLAFHTCIVDADCGEILVPVARDGKYCGGVCPIYGTHSFAVKLAEALADDAEITSICEANAHAQCASPGHTCPALSARCVDGACQ